MQCLIWVVVRFGVLRFCVFRFDVFSWTLTACNVYGETFPVWHWMLYLLKDDIFGSTKSSLTFHGMVWDAMFFDVMHKGCHDLHFFWCDVWRLELYVMFLWNFLGLPLHVMFLMQCFWCDVLRLTLIAMFFDVMYEGWLHFMFLMQFFMWCIKVDIAYNVFWCNVLRLTWHKILLEPIL